VRPASLRTSRRSKPRDHHRYRSETHHRQILRQNWKSGIEFKRPGTTPPFGHDDEQQQNLIWLAGPFSVKIRLSANYNRRVQADPSSPIILAEKLTKVYMAGRVPVPAVRGVSLSVAPGEFVSIVGPSGSGKSTLFYLLGGLTRATEGRIVIDGVDFATLNDSERTRLRKHRIAFVFQKFNLLPTLSAMGNIEVAYTVSGRKEPMDRAYLDHLSDLLSIRGRLQHRPSELSGGEQQRVAIARALITRPAIVLADEPTGNLDTRNSEAVLEMLVRSNRELSQTTLMITHNPEAAAIAGRILHMRDGEIISVETRMAREADRTSLPNPGGASV
jgi:putative ABC transport system ATP-binding protein